MPTEGPNPFVYAIPAILVVAGLLYFLYGAFDRMGLETHQAEAYVTGRQFNAGSTTYRTTVVDGRTITQSDTNPDAYIVTFELDGVPTGGAVSRELYESLETGELVQVEYRRTRFTNQLVVTSVSR
jgi:hypothetical protein